MNMKRGEAYITLAIALIVALAFIQPALACAVYVDGYVTYCGCTPAEGLIIKVYNIESGTGPEWLMGTDITDSSGYYRIDFEIPLWEQYYRIELWSSDGTTLLDQTIILWETEVYHYQIDFKLPGICEEYQGLTPGFWKNHLNAWEGYSPSEKLDTVFTNDAIGVDLSQYTLLQALKFKGGSDVAGAERILLRAAVAALLNAAASEINYPLTTTEVITQVNDALASNNRATILELASQFDSYNNLGL